MGDRLGGEGSSMMTKAQRDHDADCGQLGSGGREMHSECMCTITILSVPDIFCGRRHTER